MYSICEIQLTAAGNFTNSKYKNDATEPVPPLDENRDEETPPIVPSPK